MSDPVERLNAALSGRYRIERKLGEGGMASVYLADDLRHERRVALKVLKPELAAVVGAERFLSEIKTTANLQHPHILPLYDSGEADSFLYYVMPYVEGETLRERLDREKQLPVEEAVRLAVAAAGALGYAHEHGVVHRDIKPGNILMQAGQPMVGDFGIALAVGAAGGTRLTETGLSVGTPYYMSPEQATGDMDVGPASDIYALGAVLYELLTGDPPYTGSTAQAVLGKILQGGPVSATTVRRSIPANVDAAIGKALEKLPADRFTSAHDFAKALTEPSFRSGAEVSRAARHRLWNPLSIGMSGLAAGLALLAGWALTRPPPPAPVMRLSLKTEPNEFPTEWISLSPDGTSMVMSHPDESGAWKLWLRRFSELTETAIPGVDNRVNDPVISPDGSEVAYFDNNALKVAPLAGGLTRTLAENALCCGRWGGDGYIYYTSSLGPGAIQRVPVQGGTPEDVTTAAQDEDGQHGYFQPLPGGKAGIFTVFSSPPRIEAIRLATGERSVVTPGMRAYYASTGHLVFASTDGRLLAAPFDVDGLELESPPVPVVENVSIPSSDPAYTLSANGTLLYWQGPASASKAEFAWLNEDGNMSPVESNWSFDPGTANYSWSLSPDGTRLAYTGLAGGDGGEIWVKDLRGGQLSRLTFNPSADWGPRWSDDGNTIFFVSDRSGTGGKEIWSKRADGTGEAQKVLTSDKVIAEFDRTPAGDTFVLRTSGGSRDLVVHRATADAQDSAIIASPDYDEVSPVLSPDGHWLAYVSFEGGTPEVYVRPFPDVSAGRWQISSGGAVAPHWSRSGKELVYATQSGFVVARFEGGSSFRVVGTTTVNAAGTGRVTEIYMGSWYDLAPDGRVLIARPFTGGQKTAEPELILVQNFFQELKARVPN